MITLKIASPSGKIYNGTCGRVQVKTTDGVITILPKHVPLVSVILNGYVIIDNETKYEISNGMVTVNENSQVDILVMDIEVNKV